MNKRLFHFLLLFFISVHGWSQTDPLHKKISINIDKQSIENTLIKISKTGNINFSFNSDIIPLDSVVSLHYEKKEVLIILNHLFSKRYYYKTAGQHIIILKNQSNANKTESKEKIYIQGSIFENGNNHLLPNVSVYDVNGKNGVLTDQNGYFNICLFQTDYISLAISKKFYKDTIIIVRPQQEKSMEIALTPIATIEHLKPILADSISGTDVENSTLVPVFVGRNMMIHANNISYYRERPAQISFLPFWGSNYKLSGSIINHVSLNMLAGYSYGVSGVEVGGMLNINRKSVKGVQIGGFGNITGKEVNGVQTAGFFNHTLGKFKGTQIAGFYNLIQDSTQGAQIAGFANFVSNNVKGLQLAGFTNITTKDFSGFQLSGFANISKDSSKGFQLAGFSNIVKEELSGFQLSGFLNYAKKVRGSQVAFINIADTVSGITLGIFNFIRKGYHCINVTSDEMMLAGLEVSMGTPHLYDIIGISMNPWSDSAVIKTTLGFGTLFLPKRKFNFNLELTVANFKKMDDSYNDNNLLYKASLRFNYFIFHHIAVFAGPSYNLYISSNDKPDFTETITYLSSYKVSSSPLKKSTLHEWAGISFGLKIKI